MLLVVSVCCGDRQTHRRTERIEKRGRKERKVNILREMEERERGEGGRGRAGTETEGDEETHGERKRKINRYGGD